MSKFKPGVRVAVIDSDTHEIRKGVIDRIYEALEIAIVKFDDGNVEKVGFDYLGIESEEKSTEDEEKIEIAITKTEFIKTGAKVTSKLIEKLSPRDVVVAGIITVELFDALSGAERDND